MPSILWEKCFRNLRNNDIQKSKAQNDSGLLKGNTSSRNKMKKSQNRKRNKKSNIVHLLLRHCAIFKYLCFGVAIIIPSFYLST